MKLSLLFLSNAKIVSLMILISMVLGGGIAAAINPGLLLGEQWSLWKNAYSGMIIGSMVTTIVMVFELGGSAQRLRELPFAVALLIRSVFYTSVIVLVELFVSYLFLDTSLAEFVMRVQSIVFNWKYAVAFVAALAVACGINFLFAINRMLGQKMLWRYLTGRYHRPVEEERIFMFLDVKHSTKIAEKIGHVRFHSFLSEVYFDVTRPIIESDGEIYKYVGDEVIVTWTIDSGLRKANCVQCYFKIAKKLKSLRPKYKKKYGFVPDFRCGIHFGTVVTGELGDYKKEISFLGDVVNTTSRILEECKVQKTDFLISTELVERVSLPDGIQFVQLGEIKLRGKENAIQLSSLAQKW